MAEKSEVVGVDTDAGDQAELAAVLAVLAAAKLRLFLASFAPTPLNVEADFVAAEATFTGYPAGGIAATYTAVGLGADGNAVAESNRAFFQMTDVAHPNMIGGCWLETAGGVVWKYWIFPAPISLNIALNFLAVTLKLRQRGASTCDVDY